jgi:hypothetical protein
MNLPNAAGRAPAETVATTVVQVTVCPGAGTGGELHGPSFPKTSLAPVKSADATRRNLIFFMILAQQTPFPDQP